MFRCFALLLTLLCAACSTTALPVYIAADEPDAVIEAAASAVDTWNEHIGYRALSLRIVGDARAAWADPFAISIATTERVQGPEFRDAYTRAWVLENRVSLEDGATAMDEHLLHRLLAHELGHALGLDHFEARRNLMAEDPYPEDAGTELTRKQVRRVRSLLAARLAAWPVHP